MNIERFHKILEAYGTREGNWPSAERRDAQQFIEQDTQGQQLLQKYRQLDIRLNEYIPRYSPAIRNSILENLAASPMDSFINWLIPELRSEFWRPLVAGALPLVIGIVIGTSAWINVPDLYNTGQSDSWETEEVFLLAFDESQIAMEVSND